MMQPLWPSASGSFFDISPTARRITLKVPAMFTCRRHAADGHICSVLSSSSSVSPSYVDDTLEVLQAVWDVLLEVVGFNGHCDAGTVHCQVHFTEFLSRQGHRRLHVSLWGHLGEKQWNMYSRSLVFAIWPFIFITKGCNKVLKSNGEVFKCSCDSRQQARRHSGPPDWRPELSHQKKADPGLRLMLRSSPGAPQWPDPNRMRHQSPDQPYPVQHTQVKEQVKPGKYVVYIWRVSHVFLWKSIMLHAIFIITDLAIVFWKTECFKGNPQFFTWRKPK